MIDFETIWRIMEIEINTKWLITPKRIRFKRNRGMVDYNFDTHSRYM